MGIEIADNLTGNLDRKTMKLSRIINVNRITDMIKRERQKYRTDAINQIIV